MKKNKKTQKKTFVQKLNPNTPKKKLLAVVLVFAVMGGSVAAYNAFAFSGTQKSTAFYGAFPDQTAVSKYVTREKDVNAEGGKKNTVVAKMPLWKSEFIEIRGDKRTAVFAPIVQACVTYRNTSVVKSQKAPMLFHQTNAVTRKSKVLPTTTSTKYSKVCTDALNNTNTAYEKHNVKVLSNGTAMNVVSLNLEYYVP